MLSAIPYMVSLVTGASGFIGLNLIKRLSRKVCIVRDVQPYPWVRDALATSVVVRGDLLDKNLVSRAICKYRPEIIFNLAAIATVRAGYQHPDVTLRNNVLAVVNLLEACRRTDSVRAIIHLSTDKVYGQGEGKLETDNIQPSGIYETSKCCQELIVQAYSITYGLPVTIIRSCNAYGPSDLNYRVIPNIIRSLIRKRPVILLKNVSYPRQYIYVDDLLDAVFTIVNANLAKGEIFNIGSDDVVDQGSLVRTTVDIFEDETGYRGSIEEVESSLPELGSQSLDYSKLKALGWKPKVRLEEGIRRTVKWWLQVGGEIIEEEER